MISLRQSPHCQAANRAYVQDLKCWNRIAFAKRSTSGRNSTVPAIRAQQQQYDAMPRAQMKQHQYEDLDSALDKIGAGTFQILLLSCICLVWAGDAAEVMVLSYLGPAASCNFGFESPTSQSLLTSSVFVGMLLGAASWGFLADEVGRKKALLASTAVVVGAGLASAAAPTPLLLLLSRACVGFGLAGAPVAFTLMMELLPARSRSLWGVLIELAWPVGTIAEAALAWAVLNTQGWRLLLLLSTGPLIVLLVLLRWLPESPRYLLAQGDAAGAVAVLQHMAGMNGKQPLTLPALTHAAAPPAAELHGDGSEPPQGPSQHLSAETETAPLLHRPTKSIQLSPRQHLDHSHSEQDTLWQRDSSSQQQQHNPSDQQQQQQASTPHASNHSHLTHQHIPVHSSWRPGQSAWVVWVEVQHAVATLWGGPYATTTTLLVLSWAAVACAYYGLVQLDGQLHIQSAGDAGGAAPACVGGMLQVPTSDYAAVMTTATAEVPAVAWAAAMSKGFGGRSALVSSLVLGCVCLAPAIVSTALSGSSAQAATGSDAGWSPSLTEASMFGSRLFVSAAFSLLWVFTPSYYPTRVRGLGLGISNACGRIGGLFSPFLAINLAMASSPAAAQALFAVLCLAAAGAVLATPHGHTTDEQQLEEDEGEN